MKIKVGLDSLRLYQRMSYSLHYALGELVDNAIQAYLDEREVMDKLYKKAKKKLEIHITYDKEAKTLRVVDNSTGITKKRLSQAFDIGSEIDDRKNSQTSMGQFNVGMKASSIWLAEEWILRTKRHDEEHEREMIIVNEDVFSGNDEIPEVERNVGDITKHYTVLEFSNLRHTFNKTVIHRTKRYLSSMYRYQIGKSIKIFWGTEQLLWDDFILAEENGKEVKVPFGPAPLSEGDDRIVKGWIGVLASGLPPELKDRGAKYENAGISILRRGRMIEGAPDAWKPKGIFASGQGSLVAQRIVGEINFDQGSVSYDKSQISEDDKAKLNVYLEALYKDYNLAKKAKKKVKDETDQKSTPEQDIEDLENTADHVKNSNLGEISSLPIAPVDVIEQKIDSTFLVSKKENTVVFDIDKYTINISPVYNNESDQFISYKKVKKNEVDAILNMKHSYLKKNIITRSEYYTFIVLMIASRFKIENDERLSMDDYFEVLDSFMRLEIKRK